MKTRPIKILNRVGYTLAGLLDTPEDIPVNAYALFAHCFTCGKDLKPFVNISNAMTASGIASLRFDFSGLGRSEGDFSQSNLSSNETDLVDAANYLRDNFAAPRILIGHSMGGAAVLRAAKHIESATAVVTIATPSDPSHLGKTLGRARRVATDEGEADVSIGGQTYTLTKQFFDDLETGEAQSDIANLGKALLILHSPADETVEIENAARIFQTARHPKSFVSLGNADHLMLDKEVARYAGRIIAAWAEGYLGTAG